jgi:hypothetical protein
MKKKIFIYFAFLISFFILSSLFKKWLALSFWPFWLGGIVGTVLPEIDHLIYVFFANPQEVTSQRVRYLCANKQFKNCFWLLASTTAERTKLIFHTAIFQAVFLILTFWVVTSSGSLFGRGMVLAFSLHLVIDQVNQVLEKGEIQSWFWQTPINLDRRQTNFFLAAVILLVLFFGFFL